MSKKKHMKPSTGNKNAAKKNTPVQAKNLPVKAAPADTREAGPVIQTRESVSAGQISVAQTWYASGPVVFEKETGQPEKKKISLKTALEAYERKDYDTALEETDLLLYHNPDSSQLWNNMGVMLRKKEQTHASIACYENAIRLTPDWAGAWSNYGNALKALDRLDDALAAYTRALELEPETASHCHHMGLILRLLERHEQALWYFQKAIRLDPTDSNFQWDAARSYLTAGDYPNGWDNYKSRYHIPEMVVRQFDEPAWTGEDLTGKRLLVYAEQGFGDTLMGLRFVPWIKKEKSPAQIIFETQVPLGRLVRNVEGVDTLVARKQTIPPFDIRVSLMDLPQIYSLTWDTLPPPPRLTWDIADRQRFKKLVDHYAKPKSLKVAVIWSGSVTFKNNQKRAVTLNHFLRFASLDNVRLFSIQKGPPQDQIKDLNLSSLVVDLGSHIRDFADTAAALQEMDVLVMTDSSAAHLAGCLGVPVWNLLDIESYWLYLSHREDTPWYPSMRLIRQKNMCDWKTVFDRVAGDLASIAARKAAGEQTIKQALLPYQNTGGL